MAETSSAPPEKVTPDLLKLIGVVVLGAFVVLLDATMTNVAFQTLLREFDAPLSTVQWISTAYLLSVSMVIPLTGWLVDRYGAKPMWLLSLVLFFAGSLLCGSAWSINSLIFFRVLQGVGGGMLPALAQMILARAAGPDRIGRAMAAVGVPAMLGPVLGPVLGGLIVDDLGWRWIFFVNAPICLFAFVAAQRVMSSSERDRSRRLDLIGLLLLPPACALIVYGLATAGSRGGFGDRRVVITLVAGAALLVCFVIRGLLTGAEPIIDLRLFRSRAFSTASIMMFLSGCTLFGAIILFPLYYQQVRGASTLHAGLLLSPLGLGMAVALVAAGRLTDRVGARSIALTGLLLGTASTIVYTRLGAHTDQLLLAGSLFVSGMGLGAAIVPVMASAYRGLTETEIPRATSAVRIFQQLGGAFGSAVLTVVLQRQVLDQTAGRPDPARLSSAFGHTFHWVLGFTLVAIVPALFLPRSAKDPAASVEKERSAGKATL
ncbi:MDR family MFS transporter [Actinomadura sp. DC4]|uniref:MDR family MFS transporter n=1 Tax=Actinomadura sp. DC4 TaxID=3055069 RepID=UPI0025AFDC43|nr:MDR family MFS transporter [Actinomadura sp. DC4]MDN3358538.1 MDR family MFS transporter [Actinomadura sp. DC4]